jgi:hypothetical protein
MTLRDIAKPGKLLAQFLIRFADYFARPAGRALRHSYVSCRLSDIQPKNAEAIALDQNVAPYGRNFASPDLLFPMNHQDTRMPAKTRVLGIGTDKAQIAVPETLFAENVGDTGFESTLDGLKFTVRYSPESKSLRVVTADSGLSWMYSFWFAWAAFHRQTDI